MPDILIVTFDAGGNVPPALGIGKELLAAGIGFASSVTRRSARPSTRQDSTSAPTGTRRAGPDRGHELVDRAHHVARHADQSRNRAGSARRGPGRSGRPRDHRLHAVQCARRRSARGPAPRRAVPHVLRVLRRAVPAWAVRDIPPVEGTWTSSTVAASRSRAGVLGPRPRPRGRSGRRRSGGLDRRGARCAKPAVGRTPPLVLASLSTGGFPGQRAALQNIIDAADGWTSSWS